MFIYAGLVATFVLAGQPGDDMQQDTALPTPVIMGSAPILRKDI